jgi:TrmH family RNA methyltransferase
MFIFAFGNNDMVQPLSQNQLKTFRSLRVKKYRHHYGQFLIEGVRMCEEAIYASRVPLVACIVDASLTPNGRLQALLDTVREKNIPCYSLDRHTFPTLCETRHPQGIVCVVEKPHYSFHNVVQGAQHGILALDGIQDPGNLGTIIRTAHWFGIDALLLSPSTVDCYNAKVVRSTMGGIFHVPVFSDLELTETVKMCKSNGFTVQAAVAAGGSFPLEKKGRTLVMIGSEAEGIREPLLSMADEYIHIPRQGGGESLNVAIASGILMYEMTK